MFEDVHPVAVFRTGVGGTKAVAATLEEMEFCDASAFVHVEEELGRAVGGTAVPGGG